MFNTNTEFVKKVLSNVTYIEILGDWTIYNETIGLDNIIFYS